MAIRAHAAATSQLPKVFERFFETKTARDAEGTMAFFAPDMVCYIDATLGWEFDSHAALQAAMELPRHPPTTDLGAPSAALPAPPGSCAPIG
jgi:hypothetical protein